MYIRISNEIIVFYNSDENAIFTEEYGLYALD